MAAQITDKRTIMVCDDDKDILTVITKGLEHAGHHVSSYNDPALVLEHVKSGCKDCGLLVTDVRMPSMNGFQLVRRVRELRPDMMVIMMTAFEVNKPEFKTVFPSMKVDSVLRKPFAPSKLAEIIKEIYVNEKLTSD